MPLSPLCVVSDNGGPFVPTTGGVNVAHGDSIQIQLANATGVGSWFLTVYGTDELTTAPSLTNVNPSTGLVISPTSIVSFTYPGLPSGRSIVFQSTVTSGSNTAQTTFAIYSLAPNGDRVAAVGETREGNVNFGWAAILNPITRSGAAYLYYNDNLFNPPTNSDNIQGAIDFLKGHSAGITLQNNGSSIANNPHNVLNGIDITSTDEGGGLANLTVTGIQSVPVPAPSGSHVVLTYSGSALSWAAYVNGITALTGDVIATGVGSVDAIVQALASINVSTPGDIQSIPIFGAMLNPQDAVANGIIVPTIGGGPPAGQNGHRVWEATYSSGQPTLTYGWLAISESGSTICLAPEVYGTHNSQACLRGALQHTKRLTGPSASATFNFNLLDGHTSKMGITITARVVTVGTGGIEAVGDTYSLATSFTAKSVAGVVSIVNNITALPYVDADTSMTDVSASPGTTGSQVQITLSNGAMIGTGCVVDYQIDIDGRIC